MTPTAMRETYARFMEASGETVSIVRGFGTGSVVTITGVRCRPSGFVPSDVAGAVSQGERHLIVLAADIEGTAIVKPAKNDRVIWNGKTLNIMDVNDATRRIAGVDIAYDLTVKGA